MNALLPPIFMKSPASLALVLSAGLVCPAVADVFRMKDGTTYEGKILREDADSYYVEVQVTKSIKDERTLKKADVDKVEREQADEKAFQSIKGLAPAPDLLSLAEYDARLEKIYQFIEANKTSPLAEDAKKMAGQLEEERDAVQAGGVKLGGHLISGEERNANKFDIDARVIETKIRALAKGSQWTQALREFEALEKDYQSSASFKEVLPVVREVVGRYQAQATENAASFDARMKERAIGLERMDASSRAASTAAIAEQTAVAKQNFEAEKKANQKWVTPNPELKESLAEAARYAEQESKRLASLDLSAIPDGGKAWRDAWAGLTKGDAAAASTLLSNVRTAKLPDRYIAELEAIAAKLAPPSN
jgi:hypothetical protein